ncbi:cytochrome b561 [Histoplasma ohiense]|nr:cytochrome b561 [Histoplasma ohiense (nom. inval.)]
MASATGIPEQPPAAVNGADEYEPLLGRPGDVSQKEHQSLVTNLFTGSATIAQAGIWILAALVWNGIFSHELIFFSPHPLLNSAAILLTTQAILILQPTHTPSQKRSGTLTHFGILALANLCFISALVIIEINKAPHPEYRFHSLHGIMGLITYILIFLQAAVGVAQYFFPAIIFGSVDDGKKIYKYHRVSGYVVFVLELATVAAATQTDYNKSTLHIQLWAVLVASVLVLGGVGARIKRQKMKIF